MPGYLAVILYTELLNAARCPRYYIYQVPMYLGTAVHSISYSTDPYQCMYCTLYSVNKQNKMDHY